MSKHTPGPWFTRYCDDDYHQCMTVISSKNYGPSNTGLYDNEPDTIAIVYHQLDPYVGTDHHPDERNSNIRLIASAPDLLKSLEAVVADLKLRAEIDSRGYRVLNISDGVLMRAEKAIAKAKKGEL